MADDAAKKKEDQAKEKEERKQIKSAPQYIYGFIVVLGGLILGLAIGWSSPAQGILEKDHNVTSDDFKWVASIMPLGATFSQFLTALVMDWIGRKWAIWVLLILNVGSWALLTVKINVILLIVARFCQGLSAGGFCVVCPTYIGEMAHKYHRGALGVCFQLFLVVGIEFVFVMGLFRNYIVLNIACAAWPILTIILILFIPESPVFLLKKSKDEKVNRVMERIRGKIYDYKAEVEEMKKSNEKKGSPWQEFKQKVNLKAFFVLLALHLIQQLSGINAVMYYAHSIFQSTGSSISSDVSALSLGAAQIVMTLIAAAIVDRVGRRILWMVSLVSMCLSIVLVGSYFSVKKDSVANADKMAVVPTIGVVLYIAGFSVGTGPLPWAMIGEYFSGTLKTPMSMGVAMANWLLAFFITCVFPILQSSLGDSIDFVFYFFGAVCLFGFFFVLIFVVETSKKTLEQIQNDIATHKTGLIRKKAEAK